MNCSKSPEGYYFDNEDSVYKLCFSSCRTCEKLGNETLQNCKECKIGYEFEIHFYIYKNCYKNCSKNYECPNDFNKLVKDKN